MRIIGLFVLLAAAPAAALPVEGRVMDDHRGPAWRVAVLLVGDAPAALPRVARLDETWSSFAPKMQVVPVGSTLALGNHDDHAHTVHGFRGRATLFHFATTPDGLEQKVRLDRPGIVRIGCAMHADMHATVVVARTPYSAVSDEEGRITFADVPPGRYRVLAVPVAAGADPADPGDEEPGIELTRVAIAPDMAPLALRLPPPPERAVIEPAPVHYVAPAPPAGLPSWLTDLGRAATPWPRGGWVYPLSALAIAAGLAIAFALARRGARAGWSKFSVIAAGCGLSLVAGILFVLGLHAAIATALGFGLFIGTALFAADEEEEGGEE
jgi:plastocyanin